MTKEKIIQELIEWGKSFVFAAVIGGLVLVFARPSLILGPSMEPTFYDRDLVLVEKVSYFQHPPNRGDIVIAQTKIPLNKFMNKAVIKRVIGVAGDDIVVSEGHVFRNGEMLDEPYINDNFTDHDGSWTVPENHVFVMGDNRLRSNDSRRNEIGFVPISEVKGKVYYRIFPFNQMQSY